MIKISRHALGLYSARSKEATHRKPYQGPQHKCVKCISSAPVVISYYNNVNKLNYEGTFVIFSVIIVLEPRTQSRQKSTDQIECVEI